MADLSWFWSDVGTSLGLIDIDVSMRRPWLRGSYSLTTHLRGYRDRMLVEAGMHYASDANDATFTFAAARVSGLPAGLVVEEMRQRRPKYTIGERGVWLECEGGVRRVTIGQPGGTRIELDGLVLEQAEPTVNLDTYLTSARRQALCGIGGRLEWHEGRHRVVNVLDGEPYPHRRDINNAKRGDLAAIETVWARQRAVTDLIQRCITESQDLTANASYRDPPRT